MQSVVTLNLWTVNTRMIEARTKLQIRLRISILLKINYIIDGNKLCEDDDETSEMYLYIPIYIWKRFVLYEVIQ